MKRDQVIDASVIAFCDNAVNKFRERIATLPRKDGLLLMAAIIRPIISVMTDREIASLVVRLIDCLDE